MEGIKILPITVSAFIFILGLLFIILPGVSRSRKKRHCTRAVIAVCTEIENAETNIEDAVNVAQRPVFVAHCDGREIVFKPNTYVYPMKTKIGDEKTIYFNPNDETEFFSPQDNDGGSVCVIVGIIFIVVAIAFIVPFSLIGTVIKSAQ